jgi:hypothetical protein
VSHLTLLTRLGKLPFWITRARESFVLDWLMI